MTPASRHGCSSTIASSRCIPRCTASARCSWTLGVERGPLVPLHFTVARDLHLDIPGIMLHRTAVMPPHDGSAVSVEAAFVGYIASARRIDRIVVGDWLLHRGHTSLAALAAFAEQQSWRPGVAELDDLVPLLDPRARSLPESEVRVCLEVAGLPRPESNVDLRTDARQIESDVDRFARFRQDGWAYAQITKRHLRLPRSMVRRIHHELVQCGYVGPAPVFGDRWDELFRQPRPRSRPRKVRIPPIPA